MKYNEGKTDRALRILVGIALLAAAIGQFIGPWGYIGVVPLVTGILGICPLYSLLGISTCPVKAVGKG